MVTSFAFATGSKKYPDDDPTLPPDPVGPPTEELYQNIDEHLRTSTSSSSQPQPQQEPMDLDPPTDQPMTEQRTARQRDDDVNQQPTKRQPKTGDITTTPTNIK